MSGWGFLEELRHVHIRSLMAVGIVLLLGLMFVDWLVADLTNHGSTHGIICDLGGL